MSVNSFVVSNGFRGGFRTVTIPVDGVRIYQLRPSPFFRLGLLKNLLEKAKLLNANLWAPSTCRVNGRLEERIITDGYEKNYKLGRVHTR